MKGRRQLKKVLLFLLLVLSISAVSIFISPLDIHAQEASSLLTPAPSTITPQAIQPAELVYEKQSLGISLQINNKYSLVNGKKILLESAPVMSGKQFMAPVKFMAQTLGAKYEYNTKTKTAVITKAKTIIKLTAGSKYAYLNSKKTLLPIAVSIKPTISVPAKFLVEALGANYSWDEKSKTASISLKEKYISFPDKEFEKVIRKTLKKPSGDLLLSEMKKVLSISATETTISDLNGIQYLTELGSIYITGSNISSLSPLRSLKKLYSLSITGSNISDLSPLKDLSGLLLIDLSDNSIKELTALKNLKDLHYLSLRDNYIGYISPILDLPSKTQIYLWDSASRDDLKIIEKIAAEIVAKVVKPEMTDLDKELALHDYLLAATHYDKENYEKQTVPDESHHPLSVFTKGVGVCDGYAEALQILLSMAGLESRVVLGDATGPGGTGHAWNMVKLDGEYYHLDATFDDPISEDNKNILSHLYFNLSDNQIAINHKWDRNLYPQCKKDNPQFTAELARLKDRQSDGSTSYIIKNYELNRINADGTFKKLCEDKASCLNLSGDWIYYINLEDSDKIYKIRTDGTERTKVADYAASFLIVENNTIFLMSETSIYKIDASGTIATIASGDYIFSYLKLIDEWIYFKAFNWNTGARLYKMKADGSSRSVVFNDKPAGFNLINGGFSVQYANAVQEIFYEEYIYFVNESDSNKLYRAKSDGTSVEKLCEDRINVDDFEIEITVDWVYYRNADDSNKYYRVKTNGTQRQLADM